MARVLIVDDDESERLLQRTILKKSGHELFFAKNGEEAVKVCLRSGIEVVLTDLEMPDSDGFELIELISAFSPPIAIIAVSGKGPGTLARARAMGARASLSKPVDPSELLAAVADAQKG